MSAHASTVETIKLHSMSMHKDVLVSIALPEAYKTDSNARYPVIYLLHGASANHGQYFAKSLPVLKMVDQYNVIAVCPNGPYTWWLDSPVDPTMKYETFVTKELLPYVDTTYRTLAKREKRGIAGNSMGGHGACYLALRNPSLFGVVGNVIGGVDVRPFPERWKLKERLGTIEDHPENWERHSVITLAKDLKDGELDLVTIIGDKDFFLEPNRALHRLLIQNGVRHYYIEAKGKHDLHFVREALPVVFRFVNNYFTENRGHL